MGRGKSSAGPKTVEKETDLFAVIYLLFIVVESYALRLNSRQIEPTYTSFLFFIEFSQFGV